jgi:hypothetical protein
MKVAIIASAGIAAEKLRTHFPRAGAGNVRNGIFVAIALLDQADKRPAEREVEQPALLECGRMGSIIRSVNIRGSKLVVGHDRYLSYNNVGHDAANISWGARPQNLRTGRFAMKGEPACAMITFCRLYAWWLARDRTL